MTKLVVSKVLRRGAAAVSILGIVGGGGIAFARRPVDVRTEHVEAGPVERLAIGTGTIESEAQVSLAFTISGRIASVTVHEGDRVRAGDVVAKLDATEHERSLAVASRSIDVAAAAAKPSSTSPVNVPPGPAPISTRRRRRSDKAPEASRPRRPTSRCMRSARTRAPCARRSTASSCGASTSRATSRRRPRPCSSSRPLERSSRASGSTNPRCIDQLSGGQQQRVAIARALAMQPAVVLADEPTAALDSTRSRDVMQLFRRVAHERGAAVLVVTHDHRTLDAFDTVYEMEDGSLLTHGSQHTIHTESVA